MATLLGELSRRKVFRVAAVYAATAFVVWQAADIAFPALHLPGWTVTAVVALTIIGFPIALVLAWAFDVTPAGVVLTDAGAGNAVVSRATLRTHRIAAAAGVLILALAGGAFIAVGGRSPGPAAELDRSIAVLPFANLSGDPENEYTLLALLGAGEPAITLLEADPEWFLLIDRSVFDFIRDDPRVQALQARRPLARMEEE
jgi:hypothetical protein